MTKTSQREKTEAIEELRALLTPGSVVRTILRGTARSGMSRDISLVFINKDGIRDITWLAAKAAGFKLSSTSYDQAIKVGGAGMDMGFYTVYSLSSALYPDGHKCTGKPGCPSNDHNNDYGRLQREFEAKFKDDPRAAMSYHDPSGGGAEFHREMREWMEAQKTYTKRRTHRDGGYALRQQWL